MTLTSRYCVLFLIFAISIDFSSSACVDSTWDRLLRYDGLNTESPNDDYVCVKKFEELRSWDAALAVCRTFKGKLVTFDKDYYFYVGSNLFDFDLPEFWSGMYVTPDRYTVPLLDDIPPLEVTQTNYNRVPKSWTWMEGEPSLTGRCQSMSRNSSGSYKASMKKCDKTLPFYCSTNATTSALPSSLCAEGYVNSGGSLDCYKLAPGPVTYNAAVEYCKQDGAQLSFVNPQYMENLMEAYQYFSGGLGNTIQFYINQTGLNENEGGSGDIFPNGEVIPCFALNMGDAFIQPLSCDSEIGLICRKPRDFPEPDSTVPTIKIVKIRNSDMVSDNFDSPFQLREVRCSLPRNLTDLEVAVFYHNSAPLSPFNYNIQGDLSGFSLILNIPRYRTGSHHLDVGDYTCEIQNRMLPYATQSGRSRFVYPNSEFLIYRGSVTLTFMETIPTVVLYNFGLLNYRLLSSLQFFLQSATNRVQNYYAELEQRSVRLIGAHEIDEMSINGDFTNISFSIYFEIQSVVNEGNTSSTWNTPENDQMIVSMMKFDIEQNIIFGVPSRRRRKRQGGSGDYASGSVSIISTGSCAAFQIYDPDLERTISFGPAAVRTTVGSNEECITDRRPLANATCRYFFHEGARYINITINRKCVFVNISTSSSTSTLQRLAETNVTEVDPLKLVEETNNLTRADNLTSLDVIYTAEVLTNVAESLDNVEQDILENSAEIVNTMITLEQDVLTGAQDSGSASSRLVEALETIANNLILNETDAVRVVQPFVALEVREFSASTNLVVGLQLKSSPEVTITNSSLLTLDDEMNFNILDADAAIILPKSLLQRSNLTRLLMQIYSSTKLFRAVTSSRRYEPNGKIVAATLTQDQIRVLNLGSESVKTVFKPFKEPKNGHVCGYWDYVKNDNSGGWSTDGCSLQSVEEGRAVCVCNHLTNFAILIDFEEQGNYVKAHQLALSVITIIGLVLSIIGLSFTVLCFLLFKALRQTRGQKVLFQLAIAMLCSWVIFLAGVEQTSDYNGCIAVAILLHYFILVTFMWLLVEGLLQYLRFIKVLGTYIPRFMLKASLFAWGVPLIPVIIVCAIDYRLYDGGIHYCWMSLQPFYWAFALPVGLVILTNIIVFIMVIKSIVSRPEGLQSNQSDKKRAIMNFWAAVSIFVLLGVTWVFGFLAIDDARLPFQYIFTICNAFQGFFIFLLFITRDSVVRKQWGNLCCKGKKDKTGFDTVDSKSKDSTAFSDLSSAKKNSIS